jgi:hypothetical protein
MALNEQIPYFFDFGIASVTETNRGLVAIPACLQMFHRMLSRCALTFNTGFVSLIRWC